MNTRSELGYRGIDSMYVRVELLYKHTRVGNWAFTEKVPSMRSKRLEYHSV